ncbi:MAG: YbdK family carboxylate-amine ligase [Rhodoferax sp.]|nr:YbdK family carboxylate-amine ligase [Rhodoferax sp.]
MELQIIKESDGLLSPSCDGLMAALPDRSRKLFMPEATQSTIEFVSTVHSDVDDMISEAVEHIYVLKASAAGMQLNLRGGGNHAMHFWNDRIVSKTERGGLLLKKFGFLPKRFSTYGLHVHVGMPSADEAIKVGNVLQKMTPMFIALAASSPFHQGMETGFSASRPLESLVYPFSGPMPVFENWDDFENKTSDIYQTGLASSLKDLYWDVRPKPEYGTIEVRSFDMPLTVERAVALAVFVRRCAGLALNDVLCAPENPLFNLDQCNRFLACRDGSEAELINPFSGQMITMKSWFLSILEQVRTAGVPDRESTYLSWLEHDVLEHDHAKWMRRLWGETGGDRQTNLHDYCSQLSAVLLQRTSSLALP